MPDFWRLMLVPLDRTRNGIAQSNVGPGVSARCVGDEECSARFDQILQWREQRSIMVDRARIPVQSDTGIFVEMVDRVVNQDNVEWLCPVFADGRCNEFDIHAQSRPQCRKPLARPIGAAIKLWLNT